MGNNMSYQRDRGGLANDQLDYDGAALEPYNPNIPRLRGGDASHYPIGTAGNPSFVDTSAAVGTAGHGRLSPPPTDDDFYEVPASDFYAARDSRGARCAASPVAGRHMSNNNHFDFNDSRQPNPWYSTDPPQTCVSDRDFEPEAGPEAKIEVRRFASCHDKDLHTYLAARSISTGFLAEIDQFIQGHPEISSCAAGRDTLRRLTVLPPLEAYRSFLKGYTQPARYIDGLITTDAFALPRNFSYQALSTKSDPELIDFFDGFDYRHDIIERIDNEVYVGIRDWINGRNVSSGLRKLICYAVWGNPVDAYKWFEYSYQNGYMPHRYLPDHVVLSEVPKPANYTEPRPSMLYGHKKHGDVRARMARANDQGVDVLEVLLAEYRLALVRRGHRRVEIDNLVREAKHRLYRERQDPTGVDIIDLVMDDAVSRQGTRYPRAARPTNPRNHKTFNLGSVRVNLVGNRFGQGIHNFTRVNARRAPGFLQAQAAELRYAKAILSRLYTQEHDALSNGGINARQPSLQIIRASRASAERRYVNCLIRYCRDAKCMTAVQANQLQKSFTREKMSDLGVSNSSYLLGLYPRELC